MTRDQFTAGCAADRGAPPRPSSRAAVGLLAALCSTGAALAGGPYYPEAIVTLPPDEFLAMPHADFQVELHAVAPVTPDPALQVHAPEPPNPRANYGIYSAARLTADTDLADVEAALERLELPRDRVEAIAAGYRRVRDWLEEAADPDSPALGTPPELPEGLPTEFVLYTQGAIAYRLAERGAQSSLDTARRRWEQLLSLPADERHHRSVWAAYMLGRSFGQERADLAIEWYRETRRLVRQEGFADSLGLALTSLGEEARLELHRGHHLRSLQLYARQHSAGDPMAGQSLAVAASRAFREADPSQRQAIAMDPLGRRLLALFVVAQSPLDRSPADPERIDAWLDILGDSTALVDPAATHLAWAEYRRGNAERARVLATRIDVDSPPSLWLRSKLALHAGDVEGGLSFLRQSIAAMPKDTVWMQMQRLKDAPQATRRTLLPPETASAELGALLLSRRDFTGALDTFLRSGNWWDAAWVAERVLTLDELGEHLNGIAPGGGDAASHGSAGFVAEGFDGRVALLRYLYARRLARNGQLERALPFYPDAVRAQAETLLVAERLAQSVPAEDRARQLGRVAALLRRRGPELLGTELEPDWFNVGGEYTLEPVLDRRPRVGPAAATAEELGRAAAHATAGDRRVRHGQSPRFDEPGGVER